MSSRSLVILFVSVILLAFASLVGYVMYERSHRTLILPPGTTNTQPSSQATSTSNASSSAPYSFPLPVAAPSINMASWPMYVDNELGYSIEYPSGFLPGAHEGVFTLAVPKGTYFHWPLQDDVKITILASSSCPKVIEGAASSSPISYSLNGRKFTRTIGTDVGAGNRYLEIADDTKANGVCYHISLLDHGTNGAGFYVDDPSLIQKYDAQRDADLAAVVSIFNAMVSSLRILASPL